MIEWRQLPIEWVFRLLSLDRLPLLEGPEDVFRPNSGRGFELALFLAKHQFAVSFERRQARDSLAEKDFVFLGHIEIPVALTKLTCTTS
jgi:hypothetical protein